MQIKKNFKGAKLVKVWKKSFISTKSACTFAPIFQKLNFAVTCFNPFSFSKTNSYFLSLLSVASFYTKLVWKPSFSWKTKFSLWGQLIQLWSLNQTRNISWFYRVPTSKFEANHLKGPWVMSHCISNPRIRELHRYFLINFYFGSVLAVLVNHSRLNVCIYS